MNNMKASWLIFIGDSLLLMESEDGNILPDELIVSQLSTHFIRQYPLGLQYTECYCAEINESAILPLNVRAVPLRQAFGMLGDDWQKIAARAFSIIIWDKNNQYCGRCGSVTESIVDNIERKCLQCGLSHYPRISPSVITLIKNNDHLLMARSPHFPPKAYALIAGFIESGENIEDAVHREIQEEVGIKVKNLRYFGSQSWPFPDSLMIAFVAEYDSGEIVIDPNEIEIANWYRYDAIPGYPSSRTSIARILIDHFVEERMRLNGA